MVRLTHRHSYLFWFFLFSCWFVMQCMAANGFARFSSLDFWPWVTMQQVLLRKCTLKMSCHFVSTRDFISCSKNDFIQLNTANFLYFKLIYLKHCKNHRAEELNVVGKEAVLFPQGMAYSIIHWGPDFLKRLNSGNTGISVIFVFDHSLELDGFPEPMNVSAALTTQPPKMPR